MRKRAVHFGFAGTKSSSDRATADRSRNASGKKYERNKLDNFDYSLDTGFAPRWLSTNSHGLRILYSTQRLRVRDMDGFLCIDKPPGVTSRDVVNAVQRLIRPVKVGHAGTLDPMATGVLVLALGKATKLIRYVQRMPKFYAAQFELGKSSDTEDITGRVTRCLVTAPPTSAEVHDAVRAFVGPIMQLPPKYSALKVRGRRAYALARSGQAVELQPRPIQVDEIEVRQYAYPHLDLDVKCGSGTYIRSLGRDIGGRLACGGVMSALRRTRIGRFSIENSVRLEQAASLAAIQQHLQPLLHGVELPTYCVTPGDHQHLRFGRKIACLHDSPELAAVDETNCLLAVLKRVESAENSAIPRGIDSGNETNAVFRPAINFTAE